MGGYDFREALRNCQDREKKKELLLSETLEALDNLSKRVDDHFDTIFHKYTDTWGEMDKAKAILSKQKESE